MFLYVYAQGWDTFSGVFGRCRCGGGGVRWVRDTHFRSPLLFLLLFGAGNATIAPAPCASRVRERIVSVLTKVPPRSATCFYTCMPRDGTLFRGCLGGAGVTQGGYGVQWCHHHSPFFFLFNTRPKKLTQAPSSTRAGMMRVRWTKKRPTLALVTMLVPHEGPLEILGAYVRCRVVTKSPRRLLL